MKKKEDLFSLRGLAKAVLWSIIIFTHILMLSQGLTQEQVVPHSIVNLVAVFILLLMDKKWF